MSGDIKLSPLGVTHTAYAEALTALHEVEAKSDIALLIARRTDDHDRIVKELREENARLFGNYHEAVTQRNAAYQCGVEAEAALLAYQQEAVRVCERIGRPVGAGDGCTYVPGTSADAAKALRSLPITPRAEAISKVLGAVDELGKAESASPFSWSNRAACWRNLKEAFREYREGNESERTT